MQIIILNHRFAKKSYAINDKVIDKQLFRLLLYAVRTIERTRKIFLYFTSLVNSLLNSPFLLFLGSLLLKYFNFVFNQLIKSIMYVEAG